MTSAAAARSSRPCTRPPVTWATCARDIGIIALAARVAGGGRAQQRLEGAAGLVPVVEGVHRAGDLLAGLVSLADDGDDTARAGLVRGADGLRDGGGATLDVVQPGGGPCRAGAVEDGGPDRPRVGSDRGLSSVTTTRSAPSAAARPIAARLPRSRSPPAPSTMTSAPLVAGRSALSAAATASGCARSRRPPAAGRPRRRPRRCCGPTSRWSTGHDPLHPAGHVRVDQERPLGVVGGDPGGDQGQGGHRGVDPVEVTGQGRAQVQRRRPVGQRERGRVILARHEAPVGVHVGQRGDGGHGHGREDGQLLPPLVVDADDARCAIVAG